MVIELPIRDGNYVVDEYRHEAGEVIELPIRDGNWRKAGDPLPNLTCY